MKLSAPCRGEGARERVVPSLPSLPRCRRARGRGLEPTAPSRLGPVLCLRPAVRGAAHLPVESLVHFPRRVCLWALRGRGGCHAEWGLGCSLRSSCLHYLLIEINSEKLQYITNNLFPEPFERKSLTRFLFFFCNLRGTRGWRSCEHLTPHGLRRSCAVMLAPGAAADTGEASRARRSPAAVPPGS